MSIKTKNLTRIEYLIDTQLEYLKELRAEINQNNYLCNSPARAGFYRVSLEVNKQINKLKKSN